MIIVDPGSCHDGLMSKAKQLIHIAAGCGADKIKFQLLTDKQLGGGNILLPWHWMPELIEEGKKNSIEVFASVFSKLGIAAIYKHCNSIKFAYSQWDLAASVDKEVCFFRNYYVSSDVLRGPMPGAINLFCVPQYPVVYKIEFEYIFPVFQGFSSHCLGIAQELRALQYMRHEVMDPLFEVHMKGTWESGCPDANFAKSPKQVEELCRKVN